jgi:hypothetical protein
MVSIKRIGGGWLGDVGGEVEASIKEGGIGETIWTGGEGAEGW